MDQGKRLTDKNTKKLARFCQDLPERRQKEVQGRREQVKKDVQYFKDTQAEEACCNLFNGTIPLSTSEQEQKERQQSVTYGRYETLLQQATNMQSPVKKGTALSYLESVKEWLDQRQQSRI